MNVSRLLLGVFGIVVAGVFFFDASDYPRAAAQMPMIYAVAVGLLSLAIAIAAGWGASSLFAALRR